MEGIERGWLRFKGLVSLRGNLAEGHVLLHTSLSYNTYWTETTRQQRQVVGAGVSEVASHATPRFPHEIETCFCHDHCTAPVFILRSNVGATSYEVPVSPFVDDTARSGKPEKRSALLERASSDAESARRKALVCCGNDARKILTLR